MHPKNQIGTYGITTIHLRYCDDSADRQLLVGLAILEKDVFQLTHY
jgi:hypothetical protein